MIHTKFIKSWNAELFDVRPNTAFVSWSVVLIAAVVFEFDKHTDVTQAYHSIMTMVEFTVKSLMFVCFLFDIHKVNKTMKISGANNSLNNSTSSAEGKSCNQSMPCNNFRFPFA